jgi:hypothetical protein
VPLEQTTVASEGTPTVFCCGGGGATLMQPPRKKRKQERNEPRLIHLIAHVAFSCLTFSSRQTAFIQRFASAFSASAAAHAS